MDLFNIYLTIHLFGLIIGAGAAFFSDAIFLTSLRDGQLTKDELRLLSLASKYVWTGLLVLIFSGIGMFSMNPDVYLTRPYFQLKLILVAVIFLNGLLFKFLHHPSLEKRFEIGYAPNWMQSSLFASGALSASSWLCIILLGAIRPTYNFVLLLSVYLVMLLGAMLFSRVVLAKMVLPREKRVLEVIAGVLFVILLYPAYGFFIADWTIAPKAPAQIYIPDEDVYTLDEVSLHNNAEDCWVVMDGGVYDVTEPGKTHPVPYPCGTDATQAFRNQHEKAGQGRLAPYRVGSLVDKKAEEKQVEETFQGYDELNPETEIYRTSMNWDIRDLMVVVERDAENLLFIDSSNHEPVGRVLHVGYQPHTSVYKSDGTMFLISRDGWLLKIDLETLQPIKWVRVGTSSRGTALTASETYIAIGNYEPGNVVILDSENLNILKTIPLDGELDGEQVASRAGAVVESGESVIVALKDVNSVWVIDTSKPDFPVTHKLNNIGDNQTPLHDGFLTPDGKYFIVASQGSDSVWVMDAVSFEEVTEVKTGSKPHTGPGATVGNLTFIPALGEGKITAINMDTWEVEKYIETGGPGLFVRHYSGDDTYPYIWADTSFGDKSDEVYVIDWKTQEIVKTIVSTPGAASIHPEFTRNGEYVYVLVWTGDEIAIYDADTLEEVKRLPATTPSGISNVGLRLEEVGL